MKKLALLLFILVIYCGTAFASADSIIGSAVSMVNEMAARSDASDLAASLKSSYAIAIVPSMVKAGFVFGGSYGEGLILVKKNGKWYGPSFYNIGGPSFGFQIGAENISLLLSVINQAGVDAFLHSRTKLGGDIGVTAGPVGRRAEAATDGRVRASIYSYSMTKGLFAGLSLEGSVVSVSVKRNTEYYGKKVAALDALEKPATGKSIQPLVKALDNLMSK
ncbi:MAG: lipid-binding SYLF domain-containing protein [Synergistaceae bacterium]|nr:lipid-binding SYLF domain-containing protein [Synergistaceae bacterium]